MSRHDTGAITAAPGQRVTVPLAPPRGVAVMHPLTGGDELDLSDALGPLTPVAAETALLLAGGAELDGQPADGGALDGLVAGDRNRLLLALLCASYGAPGHLIMTCEGEGCGAVHEVPFEAAMFLGAVPDVSDGTVETEEGPLGLRLPTGADIAASGGSAARLLALCADGPVASGAVAQAEVWLATADPCAEIALAAECDACGAVIGGRLDPLELLRAEMGRWGGVLAEFDLLARRYHWSEAELLAMPAHRRRRYVRMVWAEGGATARGAA